MTHSILLGALAGDIIGCPYEHAAYKSTDFELFGARSHFTDDSVLTIAVAEAILRGRSFQEAILDWARRYPHSGYGGYFRSWMRATDPQPYNSFGNGSAMRASAVGWAFATADEVLQAAEASAASTHNHPEGIKGAQATALAVFLARQGWTKEAMRAEIERRFDYDLGRTIEEIRPGYVYNETCQRTVPEALIAFFDGRDFEETIRLAVSLGGDADTLAAISGAVAEAFFGVPEWMAGEVKARLPGEMWQVVEAFSERYGGG